MPSPTPDNTDLFLDVPERLANLVVRYYDANLSDEESAELREGLTQNAAARDLFVHWGLQIQTLTESFAPQYSEADQLEQVMDKQSKAVALAEMARLHEEGLKQPIDLELHRKQQAQAAATNQGPARRFSMKLIATGSLAAAIALAGLTVLIVNLFTSPDQPIAEQFDESIIVATLTDVKDAKWAERALARGSHLHAGDTLTLTEGFAEITTHRGAIAILEAPATIELLDSDNALRLHAGKLVGLCHTETSKGFVVKTDHADITDLGTEFGVHAHRDGVETTVFVGEVAVKTPNAPSQVITHSQTARVSTDKSQPTLVVEDKSTAGFVRRLPRAPLITDASINLDGFTIQVVPDGVYEDAKLYTDRDHELNGIDAAGLPAFLLGGDLVRMPASARPDVKSQVGDTLQLTLDLSSPCDIYLLIPEESKAGDWLARDYENTGLFVGYDLFGNTKDAITRYEGGVGPGNSIDRSVTIWKRKQPATGKTIVAENITDSMYSVIVLPHQPINQPLRP